MFSFVICKQEICGKAQEFSFSTEHVSFLSFVLFFIFLDRPINQLSAFSLS